MTAFMQLFFSVRFVLLLSLLPIGVEGFAQSAHIITGLSAGISESSGLLHLDGRWITHNDSGGEAALYEIDTLTGGISRTVVVENASNVDWEDICADNDFIYIGDFGNNAGSRTDLKIYRIPVELYLTEDNEAVQSEIIEFSYEDQIDFTPSTFSTNFDAEAMVAMGDSLYIFTKNWGNFRSHIYTLPKTPGIYTANLRDTLFSDGLITGASFNLENGLLALCGYSLILQPFLIQIPGFSETPIDHEALERTDLIVPSGFSRQIEGIAQGLTGGYFLTSEAGLTGSSALMRLPQSDVLTSFQLTKSTPLIYPNPATGLVHIPIGDGQTISVYSTSGTLMLTTAEGTIAVDQLSSGHYLVMILNRLGKPISRHRLVVAN